MDDIFYMIIVPFIQDKIFHDNNLSLLSKNKTLTIKQRYINSCHSAILLQKRLWKKTFYHDVYFYNKYKKIKYISDMLLYNDYSSPMLQNEKLKMNRMFVKKHIMSAPIYIYNSDLNIIKVDFETGQNKVKNVKICATYRMGIMQKQLLIKFYPYAKSLIY